LRRRRAGRPQPHLQHRTAGRPGTGLHARRGRGYRALCLAPGGVARGAPAHRFPGPRRSEVPGSFTGLPPSRRFLPGRISAGDDHPLANGRAGLWQKLKGGGRRMTGIPPNSVTPQGVEPADRIALQVVRYRPEAESQPTFQEYEIPLHKDWVVLDGLNYIKDQLDGTLSYRWSCRMGICGSCGMTVNGEPKLTCATFLTDYAPGPVRVAPLANFPVLRDLIVEIGDFMAKLVSVKPWIVRKEEKPLSEGEYRQTPEQLDDYKQYSMCINCMLCYAACPVYGLDPKFIGPAAIALAQRYNLDSRDQGAGERLAVLSEHE